MNAYGELALTEAEKRKIGVVADMLRRGGVMLKDSCPRCGGILVRYRDQTLCVECDSLDELRAAKLMQPGVAVQRLRSLMEAKIDEVAKRLSGERDVERQIQIATLLLKYIEILDKVAERGEKAEESKRKIAEP